jgi:predicted RNA binding protein YcfA (HicA-like mRNA interferase family)
MAFPQHVWQQLKAVTADELIAALKKDGYEKDPASADATIAYIKSGDPAKRVVIHYHPQKTYGPKLLQHLLADIGWSVEEMRRLGLIAGHETTEESPPTHLVRCHCDQGIAENGKPCPDCGGTSFREVAGAEPMQ